MMTSDTLLRRLLTLFVLTIASTSLLTTCSNNKQGQHNEGDSTSAYVPQLEEAPDDLAADTIPLRAPDGSPTRYGIKSGRMEQVYRGTMKGHRTTIWDAYGMLEHKEEQMRPDPPSAPGMIMNSIWISRPDTFGQVEIREKTGYQIVNFMDDYYLESDSSKFMSLARWIQAKTPGTRLPDTTINGYECKVFQTVANSITKTIWVWRGIVLREHNVLQNGKMNYWVETESIEPNVQTADSLFRFPPGYAIRTLPTPGTLPPAPKPGMNPGMMGGPPKKP